jgi:putative flippase GtrA
MASTNFQLSKRILQHSAVKFASVGVINTLLSVAVIFSLKYFIGTNDVFANAVGYALGLACSFILNKRWTFKHTDNHWLTIPKFILIFGLAYLMNIATVLMCIHLGLNEYLAQLTGIPIYSLTFYFGSRYFVFTPPSRTKTH